MKYVIDFAILTFNLKYWKLLIKFLNYYKRMKNMDSKKTPKSDVIGGSKGENQQD